MACGHSNEIQHKHFTLRTQSLLAVELCPVGPQHLTPPPHWPSAARTPSPAWSGLCFVAFHLGGGPAALSQPSGRPPARLGLGVSSVWRAPLLTASALAASAIRAGQARGAGKGCVEWQAAMVQRALRRGGPFAWMVPTVHLAGDCWCILSSVLRCSTLTDD